MSVRAVSHREAYMLLLDHDWTMWLYIYVYIKRFIKCPLIQQVTKLCDFVKEVWSWFSTPSGGQRSSLNVDEENAFIIPGVKAKSRSDLLLSGCIHMLIPAVNGVKFYLSSVQPWSLQCILDTLWLLQHFLWDKTGSQTSKHMAVSFNLYLNSCWECTKNGFPKFCLGTQDFDTIPWTGQIMTTGPD